MSWSIRNSFSTVHKTRVKISEWGVLFSLIVQWLLVTVNVSTEIQFCTAASCEYGGKTNQNNYTKYTFFNLRKIDNRNEWKNYVIVTRVRLSVESDVLVIREQSIFIQL